MILSGMLCAIAAEAAQRLVEHSKAAVNLRDKGNIFIHQPLPLILLLRMYLLLVLRLVCYFVTRIEGENIKLIHVLIHYIKILTHCVIH